MSGNPRAEAYQRLAGRYEVRVLEPSPPAVSTPPWFADDPVERGVVPNGRQLVSPVATGDLLWSALAAGNDDLADWCTDRWLAAYRRLPPAPPPNLEATRRALQRLAESVISPARRAVNGKIGLRYKRGGFGTPFFADDVQIRVERRELIVHDRDGTRRAPITTLSAAADHVGRERLPSDVELDDQALDVDAGAASFLGDWYGLADSVLEELRAGAATDPSRVQLWPEHFDLALECGSEEQSARATFGFSPGDEQHPEPYVYVAPWVPPAPGELWEATGFAGAELPYAELAAAADQRATALEFVRARADALGD